MRPPQRHPHTRLAVRRAVVFAVALATLSTGSAIAAPPSTAPSPAAIDADDDFAISLSQSAIGYDAASNRSQIRVTVSSSSATVPWTWIVAVRGTVVASGSSTGPSVTTTVTNACAITSMSVTTRITDALGRTADDADTLDASMCPPPPVHRYDKDPILQRTTLTETSFVDRLRAAGSPALQAGPAIYRRLIRSGVNPAFALGMFHAESHSGTLGYAVITKNWGNILFYSWTEKYGATPYAPGNGYTYAKFPTWRAGVRALTSLFRRYWNDGYRTVYTTTARWLGAKRGSDRHLRYLNNIVFAMTILPDDSRPRMTSLQVPRKSDAEVSVEWSATDNRGVTGYQLKHRRDGHDWSAKRAVAGRSTVLTLREGTWTIAVRARDAAGHWSTWRTDTVRVRH